MTRVAVLMSTYNGEKYLREQIESILNQDEVTVDLYVRDDGSSDKTRQILDSYNKLVNVHLEYGENLGVGNSFMFLVYKNVEADYYAFSDQDDVWIKDKLKTAISKISGNKNPVLYAGNLMSVDKNGKELGMYWTSPADTSYYQFLGANELHGCTMVWNKTLQTIICQKDRRPSENFFLRNLHDVWFALAASVVAEIFFDMDAHILYRQHDSNVVGIRKKTKFDFWKMKIKRYKSARRIGGLRSERARTVCECFPEYITGEKQDLALYGYYSESMRKKLLLMRDKKIQPYLNCGRVGFMLRVMLNLY